MSYKLDIWPLLDAIEAHDFDYLSRQPEENRKGFAPPVVLRFASALRGGGEMGDLRLLLVNEFANVNFWDIHAHPDLQYRLLAACGMHTGRRCEWIKGPTQGRSASEVHRFLGRYWPDANESELNLLLKQFTRDTFRDFVHGCGLDPKATEEAIGAYDTFTGHKSSGGKKKAKSKG